MKEEMPPNDQTTARKSRSRSFGRVRYRFDDLFRARAQREGFRRYLEGLLLPAERNKTLTALANTEPVAGAQRKEAQSLQWFLSESGWDPKEVNERRLELLFEEGATAAPPSEKGVLVIDEHGDRKWGKHTGCSYHRSQRAAR
jgi:SRSO17 transposase